LDIIAVLGLYAWLALERPLLVSNWRWWALQAGATLVIFLPQLLYWRFAYGSLFTYSYGEEGFTRWASPELSKFLFAPMNGWLPNAPVLLLFPLGLVALWRSQRRVAVIIAGVLLLVVYACASWHTWNFGCAFGARPLVQYMPFVALAIHVFFSRTSARAARWHTALIPLMAVIILLHHEAATTFDLCYPDVSPWDWGPYVGNLLHAVFGGHWQP